VPHAKSCKKRLLTNAKRNVRNSQNRAELRTAMKNFRTTVSEASAEDKAASVKSLYSLIDIHARKGLMPKQRAARLKSRVAAAAK
jgi:small subunit ribosomal protein S20